MELLDIVAIGPSNVMTELDGDEEVSSFTFFHCCCQHSWEMIPVTKLAGAINQILAHSSKSSFVASSMSGGKS
jgi:hypothetical protein